MAVGLFKYTGRSRVPKSRVLLVACRRTLSSLSAVVMRPRILRTDPSHATLGRGRDWLVVHTMLVLFSWSLRAAFHGLMDKSTQDSGETRRPLFLL